MEDRPQVDVRQPEVTYVTFPVYQSPGVKTLTHIKPSQRFLLSSPRTGTRRRPGKPSRLPGKTGCRHLPETPCRRLKNLPPVGQAGPDIDMLQTGYLTRPILFLHAMPHPTTLNGQGSPVTTRSIFQKICPACMVTLAMDARECSCGHQFDHDNNNASLSSEEIRLQAEELYENYLAARAEQASSAVMAAQSEFARDPASAQKSRQVANLIQEAEAARAALTAQSARVAEMKKALPPAPAPRPIHAPEAPKTKVVEMKKALPPAPAPHPVHAPAASNKKVAVAKTAATLSPVRAKAKILNSASTDTDNAITTSLLTRHAARKAASASAKPAPASAPVAAKPKTTLPPVQTRTPNPAFRQAQSARADKFLRQAETAAAVKAVIKEETSVVPKIAAAVEAKAPPAAAPALTKSAPRLLGGDKKECPNCTASVDSKINRCRCGFEFPTSETLMPALSMSEEERAEFAKLFSFP